MPHIEVLQTEKTTAAPGWAYVYDRVVDPSKIAIDPTAVARGKSGRAQRAAATTTVASSELSRREQVAIQRRLTELDKDSTKDVPIPQRWKDFQVGSEGHGTGTWGKGRKTTTNVRRILLSEKTFSHYLDDEEARLALVNAAAGGRVEARRSDYGVKRGERGHVKRPSITPKVEEDDVEMEDATAVEEETPAETTETKEETLNPLLEISVPVQLSPEEVEELLSQPPLTYNAARAEAPGINSPPQRRFCEMCGYWGRAKCLKCGARVCGLDCKEAHDQDCRQRFA